MEGSATLVARIVTAELTGIVAGAVYRPVLLIDPAVADHVTAVFAVFATVAVN